MTSILCSECGIAETRNDGQKWCLKYKCDVSQGSKDAKSDCYYFIEPQFEDGEPMTTAQNLMLKEQDLASRKMRGPA